MKTEGLKGYCAPNDSNLNEKETLGGQSLLLARINSCEGQDACARTGSKDRKVPKRFAWKYVQIEAKKQDISPHGRVIVR